MYAEVLTEHVVLAQLKRVRDHLQTHLATHPGQPMDAGDPVDSLPADELPALLEDVERALRQALPESGPESQIGDLLGHAARAFIPRSNIISSLQRRLEECVHQKYGLPDPVDTSSGPESVPLEAVTNLHVPAPAAGPEAAGPFEPCDPSWLSIGVAVARRWVTGKYPFVEDYVEAPLGSRARFVLLSDWATGLQRAGAVSDHAHRRLFADPEDDIDRHAVHLGDTYYAGFDYEIRERLLGPWPVWPGEHSEASSWALLGNHEMYCGGKPFFTTLLGDPRFAGQRSARSGLPTSLIRLANDKWVILGLDTAWEDADLCAPQPAWIERELVAAAEKGQKVILMSHHQLFSGYAGDHAPVRIPEKVGQIIERYGVAAWFWGHEHRLTLYERGLHGVGYACCIGNGGVPGYVTTPDATPGMVRFDYEDGFMQGHEHWKKFAFAVLDIDGANASVTYVDQNGTEVLSAPESISVV
jgi:hypothetical protein